MSAVSIGTLLHLRFRFFCYDATVCHAEASADIFVTHTAPFVRAIDEAQKRLCNEVPLLGITDAAGHQVRNADTSAALIKPLATLSSGSWLTNLLPLFYDRATTQREDKIFEN